jgi:hypothetical protein
MNKSPETAGNQIENAVFTGVSTSLHKFGRQIIETM